MCPLVQFGGMTDDPDSDSCGLCIVVRTPAFYAFRVIMNTVVVRQLDGGGDELSISIYTK
jgi:hypothetical protein